MRSAKVNVGDSGLATQYNNLRSDAYGGSQLLPHQQASPNMTLYVESGVYWIAGTRIAFAGGNSPTLSAPGSNNIIDLLVIDNTGTLSIVVGTSGVSPSVPTYPKDKLVIAEIYIRAASTSLKDTDDGTNGYVYNDVRPFLNNGKYISQTGAETYAVDSGSANAYAANFTPAFTALVDGMEVSFRASNANTTASTLNVNSLGVLNIYKNKNLPLASGDILQNQTVTVVYDSVDNCWQMQSPIANIPIAINIFGDASDGDVNINSGSFSSGPISSNGLTRDAYFNNLTLSGGDLTTNGYRLFVHGILTRQSTYKIYWNGGNGSTGNNGGDANTSSGPSGGTGGGGAGGLSDGTLRGSGAGGTGSQGGGGGGNGTGGYSGNSNTGTAKANCIGNAAVAGGNGANGNATNSPVGLGGGSGGTSTAGAKTDATLRPRIPNLVALMADWAAGVLTPYQNAPVGGAGGGAGGGGGFNTSYSPWYYGGAGGGGGGAASNAGTFFIAAYSIVDSGSGTMYQFKGGIGGNGGNGGSCGGNNSSPNGGSGGGGGGGAGGNGGSGVIMYVKKSGTCTFDLSGGTGGTGGNGGAGSSGGSYPHATGTNGSNGTNGAAGVLYEFNLQA